MSDATGPWNKYPEHAPRETGWYLVYGESLNGVTDIVLIAIYDSEAKQWSCRQVDYWAEINIPDT
jgi:hypothetical protein